MTTLHTMGCSITQGFALPDVVRVLKNDQGEPLTDREIQQQGIHWSDIHLYQPSQWAWPQVLADRLGWSVLNHARRGACFDQISRQCAVGASEIQPQDVVIVMWTYLSRLSLQWPARTAVPLCHWVDAGWGFRTRILPGFNKLLGLSPARHAPTTQDAQIQKYIHDFTQLNQLDPMGTYDRYHNSMVLQQMTDGFLRATGARVIHLSVETEPALQQLEQARLQLEPTLQEPYVIPYPQDWYTLKVDHTSCAVIHDPSIPPAENDLHPSVLHHKNFAEHVYHNYFKPTPQ
jgi:hypothetical protein